MFTWVCPTCGKELDLTVKECPDCQAKAVSGAPQAPAPKPQDFSSVHFWLGLAAATLFAIAGLLYLVARRSQHPSPAAIADAQQKTASKTLPPPEPVQESTAASSVLARQIEVAGIRMFYDSQNKPQVRALVINHGDEALQGLTLTVTLRAASSAPDSLPLARFAVKIGSELKTGESHEIKAPLETFATLAAMPPWHQLRADVELR